MANGDRRPLSHLSYESAPQVLRFRGRGRSSFSRVERNRATHARMLQDQISLVRDTFDQVRQEREGAGIETPFGLILDVESEPGFPLEFTSLEKAATRNLPEVALLNVRKAQSEEGEITKAAIFVPDGQLTDLARKIERYADPDRDTKSRDESKPPTPSNAKLLENISKIGVAALDALWTDSETLVERGEPVWWECWVRRSSDENWLQRFLDECQKLELEIDPDRLKLPDHIILNIRASREQIENSIDLLNALSEVRKPRPCSYELNQLAGTDQPEWIEDALTRIAWPANDATAVCLLDTGVNRGHPLIEPLLPEDNHHTVFPHLGGADHPHEPHGTPMSGLALYGDLGELLCSKGQWVQTHQLESVKLVHPGYAHDEKNYGSVTQQAVLLPESVEPRRPRAYCMAVTRPDPNVDGSPSSWSAAVDAICAGSDDPDSPKRMMILSAGNHRDLLDGYTYPDSLHTARIEDPAQSWNAITVGACTFKSEILEDDEESLNAAVIAPEGGLSPESRTALDWESRWPIKPDIVMEGGNFGLTENEEIIARDSLELLTTNANFRLRQLCSFRATSAATALAANLSARVYERYPDNWPETIRGLVTHSARWTDEMLGHGEVDPFRAGSSEPVECVLRRFGYGVPNETRSLQSFENETTLIAQAQLQPYTKNPETGTVSLNDCHLHLLPYPKELLLENPDVPIFLRITLSYFIEPNPGSRTWEKNKKYHYPSCLLRFKVKHRDQPLDDFRERLLTQSVEQEDGVSTTFFEPGWAIGPRLRGKGGSLQQDIWQGTAAQLSEMDAIAIFPAKGWWATRKFPEGHERHNCHERSVRYSLIVSIETGVDIPIYTSIQNILQVPQQILVEAQ